MMVSQSELVLVWAIARIRTLHPDVSRKIRTTTLRTNLEIPTMCLSDSYRFGSSIDRYKRYTQRTFQIQSVSSLRFPHPPPPGVSIDRISPASTEMVALE